MACDHLLAGKEALALMSEKQPAHSSGSEPGPGTRNARVSLLPQVTHGLGCHLDFRYGKSRPWKPFGVRSWWTVTHKGTKNLSTPSEGGYLIERGVMLEE